MKDSSEVRWRSTAKFGEDYGGLLFQSVCGDVSYFCGGN